MILVTGASGFLGRHLVQYLSGQGKQVRALFHNNPPTEAVLQHKNIFWQQCDLLDVYSVEQALQGISEVYHCAAIVSFHPSQREKMMHFNVESTINLVNEALEQSIRKFLFVSSVAALGRSEEEKKEITEEEQWEESKYNSRYGLSKHLAELEVWRAAGEGLNAVVVNPGIILGEGNWNEGSARLMKVVYKEFPFYTQGINSWVDVKDVVKAMALLMQSDVSDERFILSSGNFSYKEVFTEMAKALRVKPPTVKAGRLLTELVWRWSLVKSKLLGKTITITKETAATAQKQSFYNNTKLLKLFPDFKYTELKTTIHRMAKVFMAELDKKN